MLWLNQYYARTAYTYAPNGYMLESVNGENRINFIITVEDPCTDMIKPTDYLFSKPSSNFTLIPGEG